MDKNDIINIIAISVLLSFSIYHFMFYYGRRKIISEKFNLFFSLFSLSIVFFIMFVHARTSVISSIIPNMPADINPPIVFFITILITYFYVKILILLLNPPDIFFIFSRIMLSVLFLIELISFMSVIKGFDWYSKYLDFYLTFMDGFVIFVYIVIFLYYIFVNKKYENPVIFIFSIAFLLLGLYLITSSIFITLIGDNDEGNNYGFVIVYIILIAYSLSLKSNNEFKELVILKNDLENIITDRTNKLKTATEEIKKSYLDKENYFIQVSHEIKTPLTLIDNYIDKEIEERGMSDSLKIVKYSLIKLKKDVTDVLDLEKIGNNENKSETVDFSALLEKYINIFIGMMNRKNIRLSHSIEKNILLQINPYDLEKIINNLVENSIKYTDNGGTIDIRLMIKAGKIYFSVEDNGIGISDEEKENIFKPYYQVNYGNGIGIGLYIVKKILDRIKAEITVVSEKNKGTKFIVEFIPEYGCKNGQIVEKIQHNEILPSFYDYEKKIRIPEYDIGKKTIFIIEDNKDLLHFLFNSFIQNHNVYYAENGISALAEINMIAKPDLIISDIMMDKMDGFEFYDNIKNNAKFNDIPLIFLTAKSNDKFKLKGLEKGAIDFISKPFKIRELMMKAESIINNRALFETNNMSKFKNRIFDALKFENEDGPAPMGFYNGKISRREHEVIGLILSGKEIKEIGAILNLSDSGVKKRLAAIYKKYGVNNKVELINMINSKKQN